MSFCERLRDFERVVSRKDRHRLDADSTTADVYVFLVSFIGHMLTGALSLALFQTVFFPSPVSVYSLIAVSVLFGAGIAFRAFTMPKKDNEVKRVLKFFQRKTTG